MGPKPTQREKNVRPRKKKGVPPHSSTRKKEGETNRHWLKGVRKSSYITKEKAISLSTKREDIWKEGKKKTDCQKAHKESKTRKNHSVGREKGNPSKGRKKR